MHDGVRVGDISRQLGRSMRDVKCERGDGEDPPSGRASRLPMDERSCRRGGVAGLKADER